MWGKSSQGLTSATEGPRSSGEKLTMSCWTWYKFRIAAPVCQCWSSSNPPCSYYRLFFSCSALICAAAEVSPCTVFMSHITYLIFALCWSMKLTAFSCRFWRFKCHKGKRKSLSPTRPFTWMDSDSLGFWARDGWVLALRCIEMDSKKQSFVLFKVNVWLTQFSMPVLFKWCWKQYKTIFFNQYHRLTNLQSLMNILE